VAQEQSGFPVTVSAFIRPNPANTLVSASLHYRVNSGSFTEAAMTPQGGNNYSANVPGQSNGDFVEYYIRAEDSSGRVSAHPQFAPSTWFNSYSVSSTGVAQGEAGPVNLPGMLSPNPFSSSLVFAGEPDTQFTVLDLSGRTVFQGTADSQGLMTWVPGGDIPGGVYLTRFSGPSRGVSRAVLIR
jgi:hypothetical protein